MDFELAFGVLWFLASIPMLRGFAGAMAGEKDALTKYGLISVFLGLVLIACGY